MTCRRTLAALTLLLASLPAAAATTPETRWRWSELTPSGGDAPEPRQNGTAVWDPAGRRMVLFGGRGAQGTLADVWSFQVDSRRWSRLATTGAGPSPRFGHVAVYDPVHRAMVVWSGQGAGFFDDAYALDLATGAWTALAAGAPPRARYGSAAVYDGVGRRLVMFGGFTDAGRYRDAQALGLATLDTAAWSDLTPSVTPVERCLHTVALQRDANRLILYGGQRSGPLDDLWAFELASRSWSQLTAPVTPAGRFFASSFLAGDGRFYVVFGSTSGGNVNETWSYDFGASNWTRLEIAGAPAPRNSAMTAYVEDEDRLLVFGGSGERLYGDVWELVAEPVPPAETWILPSAARAPGAGGATFTTELSLANTGSAAVSVTLKFLGHDQDGRGGAEKSVTLAPGKTVTYRDFLGELFELSEDFGAVRIASSSPSLAILSQTSTPGGSGTYGQSVAPVRLADAIRSGSARTIPLVREDETFRTNLILANATEAELQVDVALTSPDGALLGSRQFALAPLGMRQVSRVARELGVAGPVEDARLTLSTATPLGAFAAYAALIDNATNDPRTLLPQ